MISRMFGDTYNEALEFQEQRDKLLRASEELISTIDNVIEPSIIDNSIKNLKETIKQIKGDDK